MKKFAEFINESKILSSFDIDAAEKYFNGMKDAPDCIPTNAREWAKVKEQIHTLIKLDAEAHNQNTKYASWMKDDESIKKKIIGGEYKRSIYEMVEDCRRNPTMVRTFDAAGISIPHIAGLIDAAETACVHHNYRNIENNKNKQIFKAAKAGEHPLTKQHLEAIFDQLMFKTWTVTEKTVHSILNYNSDIEMANDKTNEEMQRYKLAKAYRCTLSYIASWRSNGRIDLICYPGYWESPAYTNYYNTDVQHGKTPNSKFVKFINDTFDPVLR